MKIEPCNSTRHSQTRYQLSFRYRSLGSVHAFYGSTILKLSITFLYYVENLDLFFLVRCNSIFY